MLSPAALGRGHGDPAAARELENFYFVTNESLVRRSGTNKVTFGGGQDARTERSRSRNIGGKDDENSTSGSNRNPAGIWRKADVVEPQVIDEEVLKFGIQELHDDDGENGDVDFAEIKDFRQIKSLALSYKNIMFIANLETFTGLRVLRLDNNIIEKIEGLDVLVGLEWLDLSFNNISCITGLSQLVNLTDLSLYANKISVLNGLDACKKLQVLSVGRNNITDLAEIQYLRKFEHLRCLNLEGNKFFSPQKQQQQQQQLQQQQQQQQHQQNLFSSQQRRVHQQRRPSFTGRANQMLQEQNSSQHDTSQQEEGLQGEMMDPEEEEDPEAEEQNQIEGYVAYVLACLPKLKYLDYQLLDKKKLLAAKEAVQPDDILFDLRRKSKELPNPGRTSDTNNKDENQSLKENFCLFTYDLEQNLFGESVVPQAVKVLKDWPLLKDAFVEKLEMLTQKLRQNFGQRMGNQRRSIAAYEVAARTAVLESEEEARLLLKQIQSSKNKALRELRAYLNQRAELQQQANAAKAAAIAAEDAAYERKRVFSGQALSANDDEADAYGGCSLLPTPMGTGRSKKEGEMLAGVEEKGAAAAAALEEFCSRRAPALCAAAAAYLKEVQQLHFHLCESEMALRDSLAEGLDTLEAAVDVSVKYLLDRGNEYFQNLEEMEKVFSNSLSESAATELDALSLTAADDSAVDKISRVPLNKEYLIGACNAIYEQHMQLLMSSEDTMQNTITTWQRRYFDTQRQQQHERSRQRVQQIETAVEELQQEISLMQQQLQRDATSETPALLPPPAEDS